MDRRSALVTLLSPALAGLWRRAAADAPDMRITRIDTVHWESRDDAPFWPHWTWLRLHTDKGLVGLGETYPRNATEAALVHTDVARRLLGRDPRDVEAIWSELFRAFDYQVSGGTEMRVLSAVDLALWDLLGQALGVPVFRLLGGRTNPRVPVYNTCFPLRHDFNVDPVAIMREVRERYGIKGIKICRSTEPPTAAATSSSRRASSTARSCRFAGCGRRSPTRSRSCWSSTATGTCPRPSGSHGPWSPSGRCGSRTCCSPAA